MFPLQPLHAFGHQLRIDRLHCFFLSKDPLSVVKCEYVTWEAVTTQTEFGLQDKRRQSVLFISCHRFKRTQNPLEHLSKVLGILANVELTIAPRQKWNSIPRQEICVCCYGGPSA